MRTPFLIPGIGRLVPAALCLLALAAAAQQTPTRTDPG